MKFHFDSAEIYIPDGLPVEQALARTTHLCLAAHQDDIEIMAAEPILTCFQQNDQWFTGVVVTDGRGSPRDDLYKDYSDEEMRRVRFKEQFKAAFVGEYAA
ncbi:MAG: PIG-L family deacetylase, partial [Anaerolineales bacterium]